MTLEFDATDAALQMFLDEAVEQRSTLSGGLLAMERGAADASLIQAVFRAAHTLKGSSATIGHSRMATLTHGVENVLEGIRTGALAPSSTLIDALLAGVDALHLLNEEVLSRSESDVDVATLVERLRPRRRPPRRRRSSLHPATPSGYAHWPRSQAAVRSWSRSRPIRAASGRRCAPTRR